MSVCLALWSQRSGHAKAVLVDSLMTIDTKSHDQSVAQQLTTTTTHELIAPSLIPVVKSPMT